MEATVANTIPAAVHVYFDIKAHAIVGDVDIYLLDADGTILAGTDATADGLPETMLHDVVDAQLRVFAGLTADFETATTVVQYRNFDGKTGYLAAVNVKEA